MPIHTVSILVQSGTETFSQVIQITDAQSRSVTVTLAPGATNTEIDIVLTRAQIKSLMLNSLGGDLTIKTNSTGSPGDTVVMTNGQVLEWCSGVGTDPFPTADVTKLYLSSTAGTVFSLRAIVTATNG